MRVLLFTGKGGVGKTTLAAATACVAARHGRRTLILSSDPAHSLGDVLDARVDSRPRAIVPNLEAAELEASTEIERHWGVIAEFLARFFEAQGVDELQASELAILPGFHEVVSLLALRDALERDDLDAVVMDCAPTASTLRLLSFPEAARWYMDRIFPISRRVAPAVAPFVGVPMPSRAVFAALERLYDAVRDVGALLRDPERTSVRLVTNPEAVVVRETQRAYTALNLFGYPVDGVIVNKVVDPSGGELAEKMARAQTEHRRTVRRSFWFVPVKQVGLVPGEAVGADALTRLGETVYGKGDPTQPLSKRRGLTIRRDGDGYELDVPVPSPRANSGVDVFARDGELVIERGNKRHNVMLPHALAHLRAARARVDGQRLLVTFK